MSQIGHSINGGLVAVVVVVVAGTVGATLYYQHSVDRLDDRADALSDRTQTLERNLTATHADLRAARERAKELDRDLAVAESDVSTLSGRLEASRERRRAAESAAWTESTEAEGRMTPIGGGENDSGEAAGAEPAATPTATTAAPAATPTDAGDGEPSAGGSWDDGVDDDGGYGPDPACAENRSGDAACEG